MNKSIFQILSKDLSEQFCKEMKIISKNRRDYEWYKFILFDHEILNMTQFFNSQEKNRNFDFLLNFLNIWIF